MSLHLFHPLSAWSTAAKSAGQKTVMAASMAALFSIGQPLMADDHQLNGVVATIAPIHSLAQAVMGEEGEVTLLIDGAQSPHGFSLKPSQRRALNNADMVLYVSPTLETFLPSVLEALPEHVNHEALISAPGLLHLPMREGGIWADHDHDHDHDHEDVDNHEGHEHEEGHEHGAEAKSHDHEMAEHDHNHSHESQDHAAAHDHDHDHDHESLSDIDHLDPHIWLDPQNAIHMVEAIEHHLSEVYPDHAADFANNAEATIARLQDLDQAIAEELSEATGRFIVFHDAYQYFDAHYGLKAAGSISLNPEASPSAKRISELRDRLAQDDVRCVFKEPQFRGKIIDTVVEGTDVKVIDLDPLGSSFEPGADLYPQLLSSVADSFIECLR